jgi:hypothetical protein
MSRRDALGAVSFRPDRMPAYHVPTRTRRALDWLLSQDLVAFVAGSLVLVVVIGLSS